MTNLNIKITPFHQAIASVSKKSMLEEVRSAIVTALYDTGTFDDLVKVSSGMGICGNKIMDHCLAGELINAKTGVLDKYSELDHVILWREIVKVLRSRGYVIDSGRLTGHDPEANSQASV